MSKWLRRLARMVLESMPLCGLITLLNPALILLGAPQHIFGVESWLILGGLFLLSSLIFGTILSFLPERSWLWVIPGLRALFALCFLITIFYPKGGHRLDGVIPPEPSKGFFASLYIAYTLVFLVLFIAIRRYKQTLSGVHTVLVFMSIASIGYALYGVHAELAASQLSSGTTDLTYAKKKNVIFIIADMLQGSAVEQFFSVNPDTREEFHGFTAFSRATSPFPFTSFSLPAILSGRLYASSQKTDYDENLKVAQGDSFITDATDRGYDLTAIGWKVYPAHPKQHSYPPFARKGISDSVLLCDLGLTRLTKRSFILMHASEQLKEMIHLKKESLKILESMSCAPLGPSEKKVLFIHNFVPHAPIYFKNNHVPHLPILREQPFTGESYMDEIAFFMTTISTLLQHLRNLGVYDEALIIITGDHGHFFGAHESLYTTFPGAEDFEGWEQGSWARAASMYNPAILIKPPRSTSALRISREAVCLTNLRDVVRSYLDTNDVQLDSILRNAAAKSGKKIVVFPEAGKSNPYASTRDHTVLENPGNASDLPRLFLATKPKVNEWPEYRLGVTLSPPTNLMTRKWFKEEKGAWLTDHVGRFQLKPVGFSQGDHTIELEATPLVNKVHPHQRVRITANGITLGELTVTNPRQMLQVPLPASVLKRNPDGLLIEFTSLDAVSPDEAWVVEFSRTGQRLYPLVCNKVKIEKEEFHHAEKNIICVGPIRSSWNHRLMPI